MNNKSLKFILLLTVAYCLTGIDKYEEKSSNYVGVYGKCNIKLKDLSTDKLSLQNLRVISVQTELFLKAVKSRNLELAKVSKKRFGEFYRHCAFNKFKGKIFIDTSERIYFFGTYDTTCVYVQSENISIKNDIYKILIK